MSHRVCPVRAASWSWSATVLAGYRTHVDEQRAKAVLIDIGGRALGQTDCLPVFAVPSPPGHECACNVAVDFASHFVGTTSMRLNPSMLTRPR